MPVAHDEELPVKVARFDCDALSETESVLIVVGELQREGDMPPVLDTAGLGVIKVEREVELDTEELEVIEVERETEFDTEGLGDKEASAQSKT